MGGLGYLGCEVRVCENYPLYLSFVFHGVQIFTPLRLKMTRGLLYALPLAQNNVAEPCTPKRYGPVV